MLLPNRENNIYPKTKENIRAILDFYFKIPDGEIEWLFDNKKLETNQIEFIARKVSNNFEYFKTQVPNGIDISNLMKYGVDSLSKAESDWKGSKSRICINGRFRDLIKDSSDFNFCVK